MGNIPGMYPVSIKYVPVRQGLFELKINLVKCAFASKCCIYVELSTTNKCVRNADVNRDASDPSIPSTICYPVIEFNQAERFRLVLVLV